MAALPLRQMCLEKALTYLKSKIEIHNPHRIISALSFKVAFNMLNLHLQQVQIDLHFFHFSLQSESNHLTHVTLYKFDCKAVESSSLAFKFLTAMNTDLKSLVLIDLWDTYMEKEISEALNKLLRKSPNLEELHCCIPFDLKVLRKCKNLKVLRLCFCPEQPWDDFLDMDCGRKQPLKSLNVFQICSFSIKHLTIGHELCKWITDYSPPTKELQNIQTFCPQLKKVGHQEKVLFRNPEFKYSDELPYCIWNSFYLQTNIPLKVAVSCFPMVQTLSLHIKDDVDIKPLMQLKEIRNLNIESIYETFCPLADLNEILRSIGGKLQHLRFYSDNPLSLNFVFKCCPNLRSAEFNCDVFGEDTECPESVEHIRRLKITLFERSYNRPIDVRVFAVTLSKCINLEELEIYSTTSQISARTYVHVYDQVYHQDLYDNMLDIILSKKPFMKLKKIFIERSYLSYTGVQALAEHVENLEVICINSHNAEVKKMKNLVNEIRPKAIFCHKRKDYKKHAKPEENLFLKPGKHWRKRPNPKPVYPNDAYPKWAGISY